MAWTVEQVVALAPDAAAARAGRQLAAPDRWESVAGAEHTVWGECRGSAAVPYRAAVDLTGPAFTCSCPSRKLPCKHALGLFLLAVGEPASLARHEPPDWVAEWLVGRRARAQRPTQPTAPRAADGQQKRERRREALVAAGVEELERWLEDIVRLGLAELPARPRAAFEQIAARLVDAQAPGLARFVRDLAAVPHAGERWPERMLLRLARLELLLEAYRRIDALTPELRAEIRSLVGFTVRREDILAAESVRDVWSVLGRKRAVEDRLQVQRTWLWGERAQRWALILDFAISGQPLDGSLVPGARVEAELCFYPGVPALRALLRTAPRAVGRVEALPGDGVEPVLRHYAEILARNPWVERYPVGLGRVVPDGGQDDWWRVVDPTGRQLPLAGVAGWQLTALSGGHPIDLFGEWDGFAVWPWSAAADGSFVHVEAPV